MAAPAHGCSQEPRKANERKAQRLHHIPPSIPPLCWRVHAPRGRNKPFCSQACGKGATSPRKKAGVQRAPGNFFDQTPGQRAQRAGRRPPKTPQAGRPMRRPPLCPPRASDPKALEVREAPATAGLPFLPQNQLPPFGPFAFWGPLCFRPARQKTYFLPGSQFQPSFLGGEPRRSCTLFFFLARGEVCLVVQWEVLLNPQVLSWPI